MLVSYKKLLSKSLLKVFAEPPLKTVEGSMLTINVETEFTLTMEMRNKRVKGYINMINAQANLVDSKVGLMSQKVKKRKKKLKRVGFEPTPPKGLVP